LPAACPATPFQHLQLLASEVSADDASGVIALLVSLGTVVSRERAELGWSAMLKRHPALRVRFRNERGDLLQEIRSFDELPEEAKRLRIVEGMGESVEEAIPRLVGAGLRPFDPVLLRGALLPSANGSSRLLVEVHHALVDEESIILAVRHLASAAVEGAGTAEDDGAGYQATVRAMLDATRQANQRSKHYWRRAFATPVHFGTLSWKALPAARPARRGQHQVELDSTAVGGLRAVARGAKASVAMLVHAALVVLAYRYGHSERVSVGTPISFRDHPAVGFDAVGLFLNVLPLVTEVSDGETMRDVLAKVRRGLIELHHHKFTPLSDLAAIAGVDRSAVVHSATSYFGITLAVHDELEPAWDQGVVIERRGRGNPGSMLNVDVVTSADRERVTISWPGDMQPWPAPEHLTDHLLRIIRVMGEDLDTGVGAFSLLDDAAVERTTLRLNGRAEPRRAGEQADIATAALRTCARAPSATCIVDGDHEWTYQELGRAVGAARALLRGRSLAPGARVGVAFGRSPWQIVFALAAWLEHLCYVPLDAHGPAPRSRFICDDADIQLVVGDQARAHEACAGARCPVLGVGELPAAAVQAEGDTSEAIRPDSPAYVMYTSGSSGRPKGVVVTHRNLASFMSSLAAALPQTAEGPWLAETAPTFDISFVEMLWPLLNGQTVVLSDPETELTAPARQRHFAHRQCTPSRARQVLSARELAEPVGHWQVEPRTWLVGGEVLPAALLRDLRAAYPATTFVNMYGPTEATIWSSYHAATGTETDDVPLGVPLGNTVLQVLDRHGHPAAPGVVGELLIAGDGIAAGYLHRPELTSAAFTALALPGTPEVRAYRSGDRVVVGPDGALYFRGRGDGQVKVRGHRIEPGEIEHQLAADPAVADAVVVCRGTSGDEELVAVVTARPGNTLDTAGLRSRLAEQLPAAMVPSRFVVASSLPRLTSGKLDRPGIARMCSDERALEESGAAQSEREEPGVGASAAVTPVAGVLLQAAAEITGRRIGLDDDFFQAGGNSLTALRLATNAREHGIELHVRDVFEQQTVRRMADRAAVVTTASPAPLAAASAEPVATALLPMQADFFASYDGDWDWFSTPVVMELTGARHRGERLADRITQVLRRHQSLSARFEPASDDAWLQHLGGTPAIACEVTGGTVPSGDGSGWVLEALDELRPLVDIRRGRPVVARLVEDDGQRQFLLLLCHHLAVDALSLRHVLDGVSEAVRSQAALGQPMEPAPARVVIEGMLELADSPVVRGELAYWRSLPLKEGSMIPVDHPGAPHHEATSADAAVRLDAEETGRLIRLAQRHGLQVGDLVATAASVSALEVFHRDVVVVDNAIHGRDLSVPRASMAEAVGWFAVNVPVVMDRGHASPDTALRWIGEQLLAKYARGHGYSLLKYMASDRSVRQELGGQPSPSISCNYMGSNNAAGGWPGLRPVPVEGFVSYDPKATRSHLFDIDCAISDDELVVQTGYGAELFDAATPRSYLEDIRMTLRALTRLA
jgi:amino acid adenylation domain-containing protein/non-ribosomal peptide synthase protein (TIGR01720 family)